MNFLTDHWSVAEADLVRRLWNEDGFSAARIAGELQERLGVHRSRNSVLGFIHRNQGFVARNADTGARETTVKARKTDRLHAASVSPRRAAAPRGLARTLPVATLPDAAEKRAFDAASRRVPLAAALDEGGCRFAVNEAEAGGQHLFCGHRAAEGSAYCPHHAARVRGVASGGGWSA